jgi:hypothetical protein
MVVHHFGDWGCLGLSAGYGQSMRTGEPAIERAVVRLVLERERRLDGLERLLGSGAVAAVKTLAAASAGGPPRACRGSTILGLSRCSSNWGMRRPVAAQSSWICCGHDGQARPDRGRASAGRLPKLRRTDREQTSREWIVGRRGVLQPGLSLGVRLCGR